MPAIDLGLGLEAEMDGDELTLTDDVTEDVIKLSLEQFDKFAAFVAEHRRTP